jgi:hypothetical protein
MNEDIIIEWVSVTHHHKPKDDVWYRRMAYVAIALFVLSLFLKNFLFSFFIIIAAGVLFIVLQKPPEERHFALTARGVRAGNTLYPHQILRGYSLNEHSEFPHLVLQSEKTFAPHIIIPLGETDWGLVREYFKEYKIREVPHEEHFLDWVAERLGF